MKIINNEKGAILAMTTGFMLVFTLFGLSAIYMSGMQNQVQEKQIFNTQAFWVAEAGAQKAYLDMNNGTWIGWTTGDINGNKLKLFSGQIGTEGDCDIKVFGLDGVNPVILSIGYTPAGLQLYNSKIRVELLENLEAFKYAAFGDESLSIDKGNVDSYNSADGNYDPNNPGSNGDIGTNTENLYVDDKKVTVNGDENPSQNLPLSEVIAPSTAGWLGGGTLQVNATTTLEPGNYSYDSINMNNGSTLVLRGTVNIFVNNVVTGNNVTIIIEDEGRAVFYLNSGWNIGNENNNSVSINIADSPSPQDFMILGTNNCTAINIKNNANFYGVIYAPEAEVVFKNNAEVFGTVVGESVDFKNLNNGGIHYDEALANLFKPGEKYTIKTWEEIS